MTSADAHACPFRPVLLGVDVGMASGKGVLTTLSGEVLRSHVISHGVSTP